MSSLFDKAVRGITDPDYRFLALAQRGKLDSMPDEKYLKKLYHARTGKTLDLENPETYNEKLQWLKLHDRQPVYTVMADKYLARDFIRERIGEGHTIPLLGVWKDPEEIDFDTLPDRFVLKCNHNSGLGMCICRDKSRLDPDAVRSELRAGLNQNYYLKNREWPYKDIPRRIICEQFMEDTAASDALMDYKFFCFGGVPRIMYLCRDQSSAPTAAFFDMDFNRLEMRFRDPTTKAAVTKPDCFDEMREMAQTLSQGVPFLRVDFYYIHGTVYVGELTFFHNGGFGEISPEEWDQRMGSWIQLPEQTPGR